PIVGTSNRIRIRPPPYNARLRCDSQRPWMIGATTTPLNSFSSCSNTPLAHPPALNISHSPTSPHERPTPFGKRFDLEISNSLADSAPFAQSTTAFAR